MTPAVKEQDRSAKTPWFWFAVVLGATVAASWLFLGSTRSALAVTGGFLQCCGLLRGVVAVDAKVAKVRGTPRLGERFRRWYRKKKFQLYSLLGRTKKVSSSAQAAYEAVSGDASVNVEHTWPEEPDEDAEDAEWINYLDAKLNLLRDRTRTELDEHDRRLKKLKKRLRTTKRELWDRDAETRDRLEQVIAQGFRWEFVSLAWVFCGVVASTVANFLGPP